MKNSIVAPTKRKLPGRPKKVFDHEKMDSIVEVLPESAVELLETLLIFDARALERETQHELLQLLPRLIHVRRAWKAHYLEHGCISCPKADEKIAIAVRMRLKDYSWAEIFELVAPNVHNTRREKRVFENAVYWRLKHPKERAERHPSAYGSGGLCNACQLRILMRMRNRYRKAMQGRDVAQELATFRDALALRYNAAQRLFNSED